MSNFVRKTKHPVTGKWEDALWADNYFRKHEYAVIFSSDGLTVNPAKVRLQVADEKELDEIEVFEDLFK